MSSRNLKSSNYVLSKFLRLPWKWMDDWELVQTLYCSSFYLNSMSEYPRSCSDWGLEISRHLSWGNVVYFFHSAGLMLRNPTIKEIHEMEHQSTESQKLPLWLHEAVENNSEKSKDPIILHTRTHTQNEMASQQFRAQNLLPFNENPKICDHMNFT